MIFLTKIIWRVTPGFMHIWMRNFFFTLRLAPNSWYDAARYFHYSGINKSRQYKSEQAARITMTYHQLEKGLSYASPRPGFGSEVVERLLNALEPYIKQYGLVAPATTAISVLDAYIEFNEKSDIDLTSLRRRLANMQDVHHRQHSPNAGGILKVDRQQLEVLRARSFKDFFNSRHSIRNFSEGFISESDIKEAICIAQKTPSVCNRQSWKVHAYSDKQKIQQLLDIQKGSRGFGEQASSILVITSDLATFVDVDERYQAWIDGGMFSMSVCLVFHSLGFGTCCLNWSKNPKDDIAIRKAADIEPQEQIIMLIAVGTLPEQFNVAYSARKSVDEVLQFH
jgi:nitroreductase